MTTHTGLSIEATIGRLADDLLAFAAAHPPAVAIALVAFGVMAYGARLYSDGMTFLDEVRAKRGERLMGLGCLIWLTTAYVTGLLDFLINPLLR